MADRLRDTPKRLLADIQQLESRAHALKMLRTAHALNEAKNRCGWELASAMAKATRDEQGGGE